MVDDYSSVTPDSKVVHLNPLCISELLGHLTLNINKILRRVDGHMGS